MSNVSAGIGRGQMEVLDKHIDARRSMNRFYKNIFQNNEAISVFEEHNSNIKSNHWLSCIVIHPEKSKITRESIRLALEKENIESRPLWKPMHLQPIYKESPYYGSVVSDKLFRYGLCLPSGSNLSDDDRDRIYQALNEVLLT